MVGSLPMNSEPVLQLDLPAYCRRIGFKGELAPNYECFRGLHLAHASRVPFENLDVLLGRGIRIDLPRLQEKIVGEHRGGYCFEQNGLFSAVLEQVGFAVTRLSGRVRFGKKEVRPRTHMVMKVDIEGRSYLADVGFGGLGLLDPIPLVAGEEFSQGIWKFRLTREGDWWVLQSYFGNEWGDQYCFDLEPHLPVDYEPGNFYCYGYPDSIFRQTLISQKSELSRRLILKNRELIELSSQGETKRLIRSDEELLQILEDQFELRMPAGTRFNV